MGFAFCKAFIRQNGKGVIFFEGQHRADFTGCGFMSALTGCAELRNRV
jgi:hypothetical protein